jgi:cobalt-zinc-cadmium efflux system membrane fusion protein
VRLALRSPIAGVIVQRSAVLGAPVGTAASLFRVVAPDRLLVRARLPETSALHPKVGDHAQIRPRARHAEAAESCDALIGSGFGVIDEATRTVPILLRPEGACAFLLPGAYVDVRLKGTPRSTHAAGEAKGVVVPAEAIVDIRGTPTIFIAQGAPGTFVPRRVRPGTQEGGLVRIEAGVEVGEQVVIAGAILLKGEMMRADLGG